MHKEYESFGKEFKKLRAAAKKSLIDISGAVELDVDLLQKIENGEERPSEELIVLLISHFELADDEAVKLWQLAGYDKGEVVEETNFSKGAPTPVVLPLNDARIVYTDMVNVSANNYGVVINFLQGLGANNQPMAVSRVGMSLDHAVSFMKVLSETIEQVVEQKNQDQTPK